MNYTDEQLKWTLAKMLPEMLCFGSPCGMADGITFRPKNPAGTYREVRDTELLHLCWLVEGTLSTNETEIYEEIFLFIEPCFYAAIHASWQQRVIALAKVKGIEL